MSAVIPRQGLSHC